MEDLFKDLYKMLADEEMKKAGNDEDRKSYEKSDLKKFGVSFERSKELLGILTKKINEAKTSAEYMSLVMNDSSLNEKEKIVIAFKGGIAINGWFEKK